MFRKKRRNTHAREQEFETRTISINSVTKVVKGGRTRRFSVLVSVGDKKGKVGIGMGKANEIPEAVRKATAQAKRNLIEVPIYGTTIPHEVNGRYGSGHVLLIPAEEGTGVIAGGPVRAILEAAGIKDIRTKCIGTTNPVNCVKAVMNGIENLRLPEEIAALRGKKVEDIL